MAERRGRPLKHTEPTTLINFRAPTRMHEPLKRAALDRGMDRTELLVALVRGFLDGKFKVPKKGLPPAPKRPKARK